MRGVVDIYDKSRSESFNNYYYCNTKATTLNPSLESSIVKSIAISITSLDWLGLARYFFLLFPVFFFQIPSRTKWNDIAIVI